MRPHVWSDGGYGMVTGCDDRQLAVGLLAAALADHPSRNDLGWSERQWAELLAAHPHVHVERGRVVPAQPGEDVAWWWVRNLAIDRPGATTAVVFADGPAAP